jgi:radical SAM enzyme (TIGR01210 family)
VTAYPATAGARDAYILSRRPARQRSDAWVPHGVTFEQEPAADGRLADVVTVFLTGRECPWRCAMCDLWQYTTESDTPPGAIAAQIRAATASNGSPGPWGRHVAAHVDTGSRHLKLYNAGSFFDPRAVPPSDYPDIAAATAGFSRVIVESHPSLVGPRVDEWLDALRPHGSTLEVAMGLETAHPEALERLNKRMTAAQFREAAVALRRRGVDVRAFLLVAPPFVPPGEQRPWLVRSVDAAVASGAAVVSLIPMRDGNGTVEALGREGVYMAPTLETLEDAFELALATASGASRVVADVWDLDRLSACDICLPARKARLVAMNLAQRATARVACRSCGVVGGARP